MERSPYQTPHLDSWEYEDASEDKNEIRGIAYLISPAAWPDREGDAITLHPSAAFALRGDSLRTLPRGPLTP